MTRRRTRRVAGYVSAFLLASILTWRLFPHQHPLVWLLAGLAFIAGWHLGDIVYHIAALLRRWKVRRK